MPTTPAELFAALDRLGIAHPTVSHPPLFTVEQSRSLRGSIAGGHTKNLFLRDKKGALFLVTALEDAAIELKSLHRRLGANGRFSFGSSDLMGETLGVAPDDRLKPIWPKRAEFFDIWLVVHADVQRAARVRIVVDAIADTFRSKRRRS